MKKTIFLIMLIIMLVVSNSIYAVEEGNETIEDNQSPAINEPSIEPEPEPETPPVETPEPTPENPPETPPVEEPEEITPPVPNNPETPSIEQTPEDNIGPEQPEVIQPEVQPEVQPENTPVVDSTVDTYYPPELSSNNYLSSLEVVDNILEPEFDKYTTEYYLIVDLSIEELEIYAYPEDNNAVVSIYGNEELVEGENEVSIVVTAEDGTQRYYTIYVTKTDDAEMANAKLKTLEIRGYNLSPSFMNIIFKYNLTVDENTKQLNIFAEPENENAVIAVEGNDNLVEGNNLITIIVTAEDGQTKREYKINTIVKSANVEIVEESKLPAIIAIIVCIVFIIALFIYIISKKKIR